jgi:hypothetical protein
MARGTIRSPFKSLRKNRFAARAKRSPFLNWAAYYLKGAQPSSSLVVATNT